MNKFIIGILLLSVLLVSCSFQTVQEGDRVTVEYVATLADGTLFESSSDYDIPITFVVGEGQVLKGLENAVLGMKESEHKKVLLRPEEAYGFPDRTKIEMMPLESFPSGTRLRKGMVLPYKNEQNQEVFGTVREITGEGVVMDFNHLLAGQSLWFNVTVVRVEEKD